MAVIRITLSEIRKRLAKLPPIDWAYWAEQQRKPRKLTRKEVAALQKSVRKARARRRRAAFHKRVAARTTEFKAKRAAQTKPLSVAQSMVLAMAPGEWWARPDWRAATGRDYGSIKVTSARLVAAGWCERVQSPEWAPECLQKAVRPPRWLYRLTEAGEMKRAEWSWMA